MKRILRLFAMLVLANFVCIYANAQTSSVTIQNSHNLSAPNPSATPPVPQDLKDPKVIATLIEKIVTLENENKLLNQRVQDLDTSRLEWKAIADEEAKRIKLADEIILELNKVVSELRTAENFLQTSLTEYRGELDSVRRENTKLRKQRKWYVVGGIAIGFGATTAISRSSR